MIDSEAKNSQKGDFGPAYKIKAAKVFVFFDVRDTYDTEVRPSLRDLFAQQTMAGSGQELGLIHTSRDVSGQFWQVIGDEARPSGQDRPALTEPTGMAVADDLHPAVLAALGGQAHSGTGRKIPALELTPQALNLINGKYATPSGDPKLWRAEDKALYEARGEGLRLRLSRSAQTRLNTKAEFIQVAVQQAKALFPSHTCLIIFEVKIIPPKGEDLTAAWIEEALYILSHRNRSHDCLLASCKDPVEASLADLAALCFPGTRGHCDPWNRSFTYSVLIGEPFKDCIDQKTLEATVYRLARHYTSSYRLNTNLVSQSVISPFDSVKHVFSLEGGATLVDGSDSFLGEQFINRVENLYLMIVALAYHEQIFLIDIVQRQLPRGSGQRFDPNKLSAWVRSYLHFRLRHKLPLVSHIEMHNDIYEALRKSLRIDALGDKLSADTAAAERLLSNERHQASMRRLHKSAKLDAWPSALIVFGLIFLAFSGLIDKITHLANMSLADTTKNMISLVVALSLGLFAAFLQLRKLHRDALSHLSGGEDDDLARDAASEASAEGQDEVRARAAAAIGAQQ